MYQVIRAFWQKQDEKEKKEETIERRVQIQEPEKRGSSARPRRKSSSIHGVDDILKNSLQLGQLDHDQRRSKLSSKCTKSLERGLLSLEACKQFDKNETRLAKVKSNSSRRSSVPNKFDFNSMNKGLDDAIDQLDKSQLISREISLGDDESSSEDEEEEEEENSKKEANAYICLRRSSTIDLNNTADSAKMVDSSAGRIAAMFETDLNFVVKTITEMEDSPAKMDLIKEVEQYLSRLRNDVMINTHFTILSTVLSPIQEETH